jgi:hypothetical protein
MAKLIDFYGAWDAWAYRAPAMWMMPDALQWMICW